MTTQAKKKSNKGENLFCYSTLTNINIFPMAHNKSNKYKGELVYNKV